MSEPKTIEVPEELVRDTLQELRLLRKSIWGQELVRIIDRLESLLNESNLRKG